jgi:DNA-binding NarL/FixJ family response regulator
LPRRAAGRPGSRPARSRRQLEVLHHLGLGRSNKVIARHLGLAENTVRVHVAAILAHLNVASRIEAVLEAQRRGLLRQTP